MFLPPDMSSVKQFRKELRESLTQNGFTNDNIQQIELAADEALTNSVAANVSCECDETIICRWRISGSKFTLYILDYGAGLSEQPNSIPDTDPNFLRTNQSACFANFLNQIKIHQNRKRESLPYNGNNQKHKNMGKGLKIINAMMDSVRVMFHGEGMVGEAPLGFKVMGSIIELEYDRSKHL
ncbi:ATP-binding protein [Leptospira sp. 96542]|nr:ATP-binding protein [Leptospira sp. 96542]